MSLDRTPPYLQVAAALRRKIVAGELAHGDALPSVRELATEYGISTATAQKVHRVLKSEGLAEAAASGLDQEQFLNAIPAQ
ncbi:GntR family transcriptional regulator, partial [Nocardia niigatensis]